MILTLLDDENDIVAERHVPNHFTVSGTGDFVLRYRCDIFLRGRVTHVRMVSDDFRRVFIHETMPEPMAVERGDAIEMNFVLTPHDISVRWC